MPHALLYLAIPVVWILVLGGAAMLSDAKRPRPPREGDGAESEQADDGLPLAA